MALELQARLASLFLPRRRRPAAVSRREPGIADDPHWKDLVLFYEYFHGDNGRGVGASHQTGWTALVVRSIDDLIRHRSADSTPQSTQQPALAGSVR